MKITFIFLGTILLSLFPAWIISQPITHANLDNIEIDRVNQFIQTTDTSPTKPPRPTSTPVPTPPPADPGTTNLLVAFSTLIVLIILIGVWLNRRRVP